MTQEQFINAYNYLHLDFKVVNMRVVLENAPAEMQEAINALPELAAKMVLRRAVYDEDLLDAIRERAFIQWSEGLSDSLYITVLRHIKPVEEVIEHEPASDNYKKFLRKYTDLAEEEIQHKQVATLKPKTDWDMELKNAAKGIFISLP